MMQPGDRRWKLIALGAGGTLLVPLAFWLFQTEFSLTDSVLVFERATRRSWGELLWEQFVSGTEEFRPLYYVIVRATYDVAGGPSVAVFRTAQVAVLLLCCMFYYWLITPRSPSTALGFVAALACFVGLHTSVNNLTFSLPVYFGPFVVAIVLGTFLLLRRPPSLGVDIAAGLLSLAAVFLVEYGILVGLIWLVAGVLRLGSASRRGVILTLTAIGLYVALRVSTNTHPVPGPFYTETGLFFTEGVSVNELRDIFAGQAWMFHAYNVMATFLGLLFSEPRGGVYFALDSLFNDAPTRPWQLVNWTTSLLSTELILIWIVQWRRRSLEERRTIVLAVVVIIVNSVFGYLYTRDRIQFVGGTMYALLLGMAIVSLWEHRLTHTQTRSRLMASVLIVLTIGWGVRAAGTIVWARDEAWAARDEWANYDRLRPPESRYDDPTLEVLPETLRRQALERELVDPRGDPAWLRALFQRKEF